MFKREFLSIKFTKFLISGGIAALVNILSRIILSSYTYYSPAIVLAYFLGMVTAYTLNRFVVFGASKGNVAQEVLIFSLVNILAIIQTLAISLLLAYYLLPYLGVIWQTETIAHIIGVIVPAFTSYLGHKYWSFRGHTK